MRRVELRRIHIVAITAAVFALLVAQIVIADDTSSSAEVAGHGETHAKASKNQFRTLERRVNRLQEQVDTLAKQPGPQGQTGAAGQPGPQGQTGAAGQPGQDATAPTGAVMFFNLAACPTGWTELTAARGRYLVGLPSGGALAGTAGTALTDLENRAVGQHNHTVNDPGHRHSLTLSVGDVDNALGTSLDRAEFTGSNFVLPTAVAEASTGITLDPTGAVAGTNAPYLQLLVCQKD